MAFRGHDHEVHLPALGAPEPMRAVVRHLTMALVAALALSFPGCVGKDGGSVPPTRTAEALAVAEALLAEYDRHWIYGVAAEDLRGVPEWTVWARAASGDRHLELELN